MVNLIERTADYRSHFEQIVRPEWDDFGLRQGFLHGFLNVGYPTHRDEEFRFTPLRDLAELPLRPAVAAPFGAAQLEALPIAQIDGPRAVFVNGFFRADMSQLGECIRIVTADNRATHGRSIGSIATYEGKLGSTNDPRFLFLNNALWHEAAYLSIPDGVVIEDPISILFVNVPGEDAFSTHPRVFIEAGRAAQAKIVETHVGLSGSYFANPVTELRLAEDAIVEHTRVQIESMEAFHIGRVWAHQESGSTFTSNSVQFGAKVGRIDANVWLNGEHTETWLNGVYVGNGGQVLDNKTRLDHAMPNCHSFEVYKGILDDQAAGVFNGKIFVYEDAQKTDAKQTNQALLLSPTASINTKPQLEIFADDVKCTHGATVGQLRADQVFYLRSRGISETEARNILVYAFAAEVLEKIGIDALKKHLERELYEKLNRSTGGSAPAE